MGKGGGKIATTKNTRMGSVNESMEKFKERRWRRRQGGVGGSRKSVESGTVWQPDTATIGIFKPHTTST